MSHTKMDPADLVSPRREISNGGLGIVVSLAVRWEIHFSCASSCHSIQMYIDVFDEQVLLIV